MKITHLAATLGKGGAERVIVDLANYQVRQGHEVAVVVGSKADERLLCIELDERIALEYIDQGEGRIKRYTAGIRWFVRRLPWLATRDVVHAHLTFPAMIATLLYRWRLLRSNRTHPRVIETYHAVGVAIPEWHRCFHAWMARQRDGLILVATDSYWHDFVARLHGLPSRIIPNGLAPPPVRQRSDPDVVDYARAAGLPSDAALVFGSIGRLVSARRPQLYVPIFGKVAKAIGLDIHFLMAGEGPERVAVMAQAEEAGIANRLHLPGLATDASRPRALIDLYITINVGSVTGLNGLEAASAGVPVIAIQLLDSYEPSDDDWIWSSANPEAVSTEAIRLLRDPQARSELGTRQKAHVEAHHTIAAMADAYEHLYRQAGA